MCNFKIRLCGFRVIHVIGNKQECTETWRVLLLKEFKIHSSTKSVLLIGCITHVHKQDEVIKIYFRENQNYKCQHVDL